MTTIITPAAGTGESWPTHRSTSEPSVVCPACGGLTPADAVFCANPQCGKALGEFRYVHEELAAVARWHEQLADRVTAFIGRPHYILAHAAWFVGWIALNTGVVIAGASFDAYPYSLLGILLSIEAIFVTGFVLISQNRQAAHADKRAELDYEVNVRTYREIRVIRALLEDLRRSAHGGDGNLFAGAVLPAHHHDPTTMPRHTQENAP